MQTSASIGVTADKSFPAGPPTDGHGPRHDRLRRDPTRLPPGGAGALQLGLRYLRRLGARSGQAGACSGSRRTASPAELQEHVKTVTAPYKYPREIEFVSDLPKRISGKVRRTELSQIERERAKARGGATL
ncbi:MAG: hypothetical protein HYU25_04105 [Candidatus Rokubacteria bacterium]|nr:hypothetical protein [Candidatus Rokubacteria bacterium]